MDITDFSPSEAPVETEVSADSSGQPARLERAEPQTVALSEGRGTAVPNLKGKTVREVTEECMRLQFSPVLIGTGVAVEQSPERGKLLRPGGRLTVRFGAGGKRSATAGGH